MPIPLQARLPSSAHDPQRNETRLQFLLLGPMEVHRGQRAIQLGGSKPRALLAMLLLQSGRVVSSDALQNAVWGDERPPSATGSLHAFVSRLRRALTDSGSHVAIEHHRTGYRIATNDLIDVSLFRGFADTARIGVQCGKWTVAAEAGETALRLWRGPLLTDLQDREWVRVAATKLDDDRIDCTENLVTAFIGSGRLTSALSVARSLHAEAPLREHPCWLYMLTLHRAGRTTEAIDTYQRHREFLDTELGLQPGTALKELHTAILRHDPDLLRWPNIRSVNRSQTADRDAVSAAAAPAVRRPHQTCRPDTRPARTCRALYTSPSSRRDRDDQRQSPLLTPPVYQQLRVV